MTSIDPPAPPSAVEQLVTRTRAVAQRRGAFGTTTFAPGRVNLIGEHTDYTGGLVLPMTLDRGTCVVARGRSDGKISLDAVRLGETFEGRVDEDGLDESLNAAPLFAKYALGVFAHSAGADLVVDSSLPLGSGLSSSASYLCALLIARNALEGNDVAAWTVAREAQRIENEVIGLSSGILDPAAVCLSSTAAALFLDCSSLKTRPVVVPPAFAVLVADSGAPRSLATSAYNARFETCRAATATLRVAALGSLQETDLDSAKEKLDALPFRRVRHVVTENARVRSFAAALERGDGPSVGALLNASHESLRADYEVTSDALDTLAEIMRSTPGVFGARMCGAGFGGCCVAVVDAAFAPAAAAAIDAAWTARHGRSANTFVASPAGGARVVK